MNDNALDAKMPHYPEGSRELSPLVMKERTLREYLKLLGKTDEEIEMAVIKAKGEK